MHDLSIDDAELLATAHLDLLAAQAEGVQVLGRTDHTDLINVAHTMLATPADLLTVLPQLIHDRQEVAA